MWVTFRLKNEVLVQIEKNKENNRNVCQKQSFFRVKSLGFRKSEKNTMTGNLHTGFLRLLWSNRNAWIKRRFDECLLAISILDSRAGSRDKVDSFLFVFPWKSPVQDLAPFKRAPVPPESILNLVEETQGLEKARKKTQGLEKSHRSPFSNGSEPWLHSQKLWGSVLLKTFSKTFKNTLIFYALFGRDFLSEKRKCLLF